MKKIIVVSISALTIFSLTAFAYINWSNAASIQKGKLVCKGAHFEDEPVIATVDQFDPYLLYKVDSRFRTAVTKHDLTRAKSIVDILPTKATRYIASYQSVTVSIVLDGQGPNNSQTGNDEMLTEAQVKLLQSTNYLTNIHISAEYKEQSEVTGEMVNNDLTYYLTITPESEAHFEGGYDALITYLKKSSQDATAIIEKDQLQPGRISFTVTKKGTIADVKLAATSGYPSVDQVLVGSITNMPKKWRPATDSEGKKVDQGLVFFFGLEGC